MFPDRSNAPPPPLRVQEERIRQELEIYREEYSGKPPFHEMIVFGRDLDAVYRSLASHCEAALRDLDAGYMKRAKAVLEECRRQHHDTTINLLGEVALAVTALFVLTATGLFSLVTAAISIVVASILNKFMPWYRGLQLPSEAPRTSDLREHDRFWGE